MRRLTLGIVIVLAFAACGDNEGSVTTTGGAVANTATTAQTTTTDTPTTTATSSAATTGPALVQKRDPADEKKDPAGVQNLSLSKTLRVSRTDEAVTTQPDATPTDRGGDPRLDVMWNDCSAGDMEACDTLYRESPIGSDYERFGETCGGTTDGSTWCSDTAEPPTDPLLDDLWTACEIGDWAACDTLYLESPPGSDYEAFGATCGGITDGSLWCVDEFSAADPTLDGLWTDCEAGDWAACDTLYIEAPEGSEYEAFGATCGEITDGARWCTDEFSTSANYGDDAYLDGLWDACEAGDWPACDALYSESPIGSDYEAFGETCGNLTDGIEWCVDVSLGDPFTYGDDAYFDGLWDACEAGDWPACDALYSESPIGSEYETFGNTCGFLTDGIEWCDGDDTMNPLVYGDDAYFDGLWDACEAGDWAVCDALYLESAAGSDYEAFGASCGYLTDSSQWCVDAMAP